MSKRVILNPTAEAAPSFKAAAVRPAQPRTTSRASICLLVAGAVMIPLSIVAALWVGFSFPQSESAGILVSFPIAVMLALLTAFTGLIITTLLLAASAITAGVQRRRAARPH